jgi:uncharacterized protein YqcC (DUF446 family)
MNRQGTKRLVLLQLAVEIESEMKKLGLWKPSNEAEEAVGGAFGAGAMTFEEWLQRVFLPNMKAAAQKGVYPRTSSVATAAVRNLDGIDGVARLIELLASVDREIEQT